MAEDPSGDESLIGPGFTNKVPRCEPDPLDATSICTAKVTADDRQGISHFFGRNKKATHSIPNGIFPLLCRTHYQEKQYRWNDEPGALAAFQCDCILKSLERMATKTWTDENGIAWPYWCGFELQTQKEPEAGKARADRYLVPGWLEKLCKKEEAGQMFISVGDRGGARYNFLQLAQIVMSIKTWCVQNKARLPNVEALPITIGMVNEIEIEDARQKMRTVSREFNLATAEMRKAEGRSGKVPRKLRKAVEAAQEKLDCAETALNIARADGESTKALIPGKRQGRKTRVELEQGNKRKVSEEVESPKKKAKVDS